MNETINVGLVGYGMAGRVFHAPVISAIDGLRLAAVVERHTDASRIRYPDVKIVKNPADLFADPCIDLVVIATPNATHFPLSRAALLAGKHVVVDKPFTVTSGEADHLCRIAREQKRILTVHQNRRWDGDFLTVQRILRQGRLGRLVAFESRFDRFRVSPRPGAWREEVGAGSGLLYDIGSHLIDQAVMLFGPPRSVCADIRIQRDDAVVDDWFRLVLDYGRLSVTLGATMLACEPGPRFVLHGTNGSFVKYGLDPQEEALKQGRSPLDPDWGADPKKMWGTIAETGDGAVRREMVETVPGGYASFYESVRDAIVRGVDTAVKPEEARDVIAVIERARQSSGGKRTIPFIDPHADPQL